MAALRHPNVVLFMGACTVPPHYAMVTEFASRGNLRTLLNNKDAPLGWKRRVKIALDTAKGMVYLHGRKIIHRDMKSYNLLIDENYVCKICDFGISRVIPRNMKMTMKGTDYYMSPEVKAGKQYDAKADVYSYGLVLVEIITRELADDIADCLEEDRTLAKLWPKDAPKAFVDLALACLNPDPAKRPTFDAIAKTLEEINAATPDDALAAAVPSAASSSSSAPAPAAAPSSSSASALSPIADAQGRAFWTSKILSPRIAWSECADTLKKATGLSLAEIEPLGKYLKDSAARGFVTEASFAAFLSWFGSWPDALKTASWLAQQPWFTGSQSQEEAEASLKGCQDGTYLVRISASRPGCFSVAVVKGGVARHSLVLKNQEGRFTVDNQNSYPTLKDFMEAHKWLFVTPLPATKK
jgi:serine/threonine protein kinase